MPLRPADLARGALVPLRWMCEGRDSHECDIDIFLDYVGVAGQEGDSRARIRSGPCSRSMCMFQLTRILN